VQLKRIEIDPTFLKEEKKSVVSLEPVELSLSDNITPSNQLPFVTISKPSEIKIDNILEEKIEQPLESTLLPKTTTKFQQPDIELEQFQSENTNSLKKVVSQQPSSLGNYSQLDQLLEQKEPLTSATAPILLPTDLLFEYNADRLKKDAEKSLEKLVLLIQRNPNAQFSIEGFTDSFGSEAYNIELSQRRADSIKNWLLSHQLIDGSKITTRGCGKKNLLVPGSGTIEEQRLNRRVEIVIHQ
jgi:outer membrane protein OmpA-like peptidoglycan-associated protein